MPAARPATVAVLTDLWPSASEPSSGSFVRGQVDALAGRYREVVLVPRLLLPRLHQRVWGAAVQGRQTGWRPLEPPGRVLRYPLARVPGRGEAGVRAAAARLALAAARERPALVHGHFLYEVGVAAVRLAGTLGVPSVVTVHGTDGRWLADGGVQERHRRSMLAAACAVDRLVVVEQRLAERLVASGVPEERVAVVPMGIDEQVFRPLPRDEARRRVGVASDARLVVLVGRATPEKGADVLDAALERLGAGVRGVVVGPGDARFGRLEVVGAVTNAEVVHWLAAADVVCLPSFAEGMPVSVSEALACGRPVVASSVGGIPEQVEDGVSGLLVAPGDADALAEALAAALERDWPEDLLRERSRPFWWSAVAPRLGALYDELLGRS